MARSAAEATVPSTSAPRGRPKKRKSEDEETSVPDDTKPVSKRAKVTFKAQTKAVNASKPSGNGLHRPTHHAGSAAGSTRVKKAVQPLSNPPRKRGRPPKVKKTEEQVQEDPEDPEVAQQMQVSDHQVDDAAAQEQEEHESVAEDPVNGAAAAQHNKEVEHQGMQDDDVENDDVEEEAEAEEEEEPKPKAKAKSTRGRPPKSLKTTGKVTSKPKTSSKSTSKTTKKSIKVSSKTKASVVKSKSKSKAKAKATASKSCKADAAQAKTKVKTKSKAELRVEQVEKKITRKRRILARRKEENACMDHSFYIESGTEWNSTNVDFNDLATLRTMWELPAACHILWLLQQPLKLRFSNSLLEYEAALLNPESSPLLEDVFTKLLLAKPEREQLTAGIGLKYPWWNKQLRNYYVDMYAKWYALLRKAGETLEENSDVERDEAEPMLWGHHDVDVNDNESLQSGGISPARPVQPEIDVELTDEEWITLDILKSRLECLGTKCPLKHQSFADLSIELRCKILLNLCQAVVEDPVNMEYLRGMEEDDLRVEPMGRDRMGNLFFYFPQFYEERRIYRLQLRLDEAQELEEEAAFYRASTKRASFDLTWKQHAPTSHWNLWAKGEDSIRGMFDAMKRIKGRKLRGEQDLLDHLEVILEQMDEEAEERTKQLEKANKRAILEAIPRKRSMRLQVKQLEQMEAQRKEREIHGDLNALDKSMMSPEELADLKRTELLKKMEREAEAEAKRLEEERRQREAAVLEREMRSQRRADHDKLVAQQAAQRDAKRDQIKHQRDAARERRALLRKQKQVGHDQSGNESSASNQTSEWDIRSQSNGTFSGPSTPVRAEDFSVESSPHETLVAAHEPQMQTHQQPVQTPSVSIATEPMANGASRN